MSKTPFNVSGLLYESVVPTMVLAILLSRAEISFYSGRGLIVAFSYALFSSFLKVVFADPVKASVPDGADQTKLIVLYYLGYSFLAASLFEVFHWLAF